jgi:deoxyribose-phosphate aldolase
MSIATKIDHTLLSPTATYKDIVKLCEEAVEYGFRSVCVNSSWVREAAVQLQGSEIPVATVIGFPFGACSMDAKIAEAIAAKVAGATEFDVVWNQGLFKSGRPLDTMLELNTLVKIVDPSVVKVIVESGNLSIKEQEKANAIVLDSGAQVIKTSTGYGHGDDIIKKLTTVAMWKNLGGLKIKASGGIKDLTTAQSFLEAGADIIGTSSGVAIAEEHEAETGKN